MTVLLAETSGVARAAVIGAGSMGGGIAAQFANAGIPVDLLDVPGEGAARNGPAEAGVARQLKAGGFMSPSAARLVTCGNVEDHLDRLAAADWIVEAVIEQTEAKRDLYARIETVRRPGTILSSNTSTIPRAALVEGMGQAFARDFVITHFFNPPRVMQLVEIVTAAETDPGISERVHVAARVLLGKTVVDCRDTPGFIANRIGCFWMAAAALEAKRMGLSVELADAVNAALGVPRTGVFGLFDLVGIDLVPHVWGSLMRALPGDDALQRFDLPADPLFGTLVAEGRFGRKSGAGFYRKGDDGGREALDLASGQYRPTVGAPELPGRGRDLAALLADQGDAGAYARRLLALVVAYAATHAPDLAADVAAVDAAVSLGYSWRRGPFALADAAGGERMADILVSEGLAVPPLLDRATGEGGFFAGGAPMATGGGRISAPEGRGIADAPVILGNGAASLHDIGDRVACFRMHTKMNTFAPEVFDVLEETLDAAGSAYDALVLGNDDPRAFSAGADLSFILGMIDSGGTDALDRYIARGQKLFLRMRRLPVPVVAAVHGFALGGGCEFMLHAHAVVAHAELKAGLPEAKVGLIPAWGGCTTLLGRSQLSGGGPVEVPRRAFRTIFAGETTGSALGAQDAGLLRPTDGIVMHRDDLIPAAKARALSMTAAGAEPPMLQLGGASAMAGLMAPVSTEFAAGRITATDDMLASALAAVLTGGPSADLTRPGTEEDVMALERAALRELVARPETRARMDHMLKTGRPLRN